MDKLTDIFNMCEDECEYSRGEAKEKCPIYKICYIRQVYDKLKEYEALEEQGLLVRKKGKWELLDDCANAGVYCSNCSKKVYRVDYANQKVKSKYCPNCGAKMEE